MSEHTPGPWELHGKHYVNGKDGEPVATVDTVHPEQKEANARLIAAAPELLAALQAIRDEVADNPIEIDWREVDRIASAAIAKAKGEQ